jgi:hypothetical protein
MKLILPVITVIVLVVTFTSVRRKEETAALKKETVQVKFRSKDFPEHGVTLVVPSDPAFADFKAKLAGQLSSSGDSYSVFLMNTSSRAIVGYRIKWECVDSRGDTSATDVSNVVSWIFLHGEEAKRRAAVNRSQEVIKPGSTWLISFGAPAQPVGSGGAEATFDSTEFAGSGQAEPITGCVSVTAIADGIFFDDGTFVGPDTTDFFTEVSSQLDARYEILRGVQDDLAAGRRPDEIFRGLEMIRDRNRVRLGVSPTRDEYLAYFRNLFAQDVLGTKELRGADTAIEEVQSLLSKPWVKPRKL